MRFFWDSQVYLVDDILTEFFSKTCQTFYGWNVFNMPYCGFLISCLDYYTIIV